MINLENKKLTSIKIIETQIRKSCHTYVPSIRIEIHGIFKIIWVCMKITKQDNYIPSFWYLITYKKIYRVFMITKLVVNSIATRDT